MHAPPSRRRSLLAWQPWIRCYRHDSVATDFVRHFLDVYDLEMTAEASTMLGEAAGVAESWQLVEPLLLDLLSTHETTRRQAAEMLLQVGLRGRFFASTVHGCGASCRQSPTGVLGQDV